MLPRLSYMTVAGLVLTTALTAAQSPAPAPSPAPADQQAPSVTFKVEVNYVEVDARVVDGQGNFIRNLKKEDFQVFEDGKRQTISAFGLVDMPIVPVEKPAYMASSALPIEADVATNSQGLNGRLYLILFDDYNISAIDTIRARALVRRFIVEKLDANDQAAVVTASGNVKASQEFTINRRLLLNAVDNMFGRKFPTAVDRFKAQMAGQALESQQAYRNLIDPGTASADSSGTSAPDGKVLDGDKAWQNSQTRTSLNVLKGLSEWMSGIKGRRKTIIYVSGGFDYNLDDAFVQLFQNDPGNEYTTLGIALPASQLKDALDAATRGNVTIYPLDPRGLSATAMNVEVDGYGVSALQQRTIDLTRELATTQASLKVLAAYTGGFASVNSNDLGAALNRIVDENSSYYVLGYYPTNDKRDGNMRKIEVKIPGRPALKAVHRAGYAAPRKNGTPATSPVDPDTAHLFEAMNSPVPMTGLTLQVTAIPHKGTGKNANLEVFVEAAGRDLTFKQGGGTFNGGLSVTVTAVDKSDKPVGGKPETLDVDLTLKPDSFDRVARSGVRVWKHLEVPVGQQYQVRVAARESGGAKAGTTRFDVEVPDYSKEKLVLSGLALASQQDASMVTFDNPFDRALPASPTTRREFAAGDQLGAWIEVYDNQPVPIHRIDITTTVKANDGRVVFTDSQSRSTEDLHGVPGGFGYSAVIPLNGWAPGLYVLSIEAKSRLGEADPISRVVQFKVR